MRPTVLILLWAVLFGAGCRGGAMWLDDCDITIAPSDTTFSGEVSLLYGLGGDAMTIDIETDAASWMLPSQVPLTANTPYTVELRGLNASVVEARVTWSGGQSQWEAVPATAIGNATTGVAGLQAVILSGADAELVALVRDREVTLAFSSTSLDQTNFTIDPREPSRPYVRITHARSGVGGLDVSITPSSAGQLGLRTGWLTKHRFTDRQTSSLRVNGFDGSARVRATLSIPGSTSGFTDKSFSTSGESDPALVIPRVRAASAGNRRVDLGVSWYGRTTKFRLQD